MRHEVQWKPAFQAEFDRLHLYDLAVIVVASFGRRDGMEAHSEAWQRRTKYDDRRSPNDRFTHEKDSRGPADAGDVGRDVLRTLSQEAPEASLSYRCDVTEIRYAGDEGGILCTLDFGDHATKRVYIVSITHVKFERRNPLSRDIERFKKRRVKRLRRVQGGVV